MSKLNFVAMAREIREALKKPVGSAKLMSDRISWTEALEPVFVVVVAGIEEPICLCSQRMVIRKEDAVEISIPLSYFVNDADIDIAFNKRLTTIQDAFDRLLGRMPLFLTAVEDDLSLELQLEDERVETQSELDEFGFEVTVSVPMIQYVSGTNYRERVPLKHILSVGSLNNVWKAGKS